MQYTRIYMHLHEISVNNFEILYFNAACGQTDSSIIVVIRYRRRLSVQTEEQQPWTCEDKTIRLYNIQRLQDDDLWGTFSRFFTFVYVLFFFFKYLILQVN